MTTDPNNPTKRGPGRPRREIPRVPVTVRLEPEVANELRRLCKEQGISQSKLITNLLTNVSENPAA